MGDRRVLVLDNGGSHLKLGFSTDSAPRIVPNTAARVKRQLRTLIAEETETLIKDFSQLTYVRPVDRGFIVDAPTQSALWQHAFSPLNVTPEDTTLLLTSPPFAMRTVEAMIGELAFETHGFAGLALELPATLAAQSIRHDGACQLPLFATGGTGIVVDLGYSATHVVPLLDWRPVPAGIRRLDVGGKALTNYLKEAVSYRQYNMMDDTFLVNQVKERLCYVSQAFDVELEVARRLSTPAAVARAAAAARAAPHRLAAPLAAAVRDRAGVAGLVAAARTLRPLDDGSGPGILREFVLPDFVKVQRGYVRGASDDPAAQAGEHEGSALAAATSEAAAAAAATRLAAAPSLADPRQGSSSSSGRAAGADDERLQRQLRPGAVVAAAVAGGVSSSSSRVAGSKRRRGQGRAAAKVAASGGAGGGDEEDDDGGTTSMSDSDDGEEEDDEDEEEGGKAAGGGAWAAKRDEAYGGGGSASAPAGPRREMAHRAARAGVAALTHSLRAEGALAAGDEDEDAGGAVEETRPRGGASRLGGGGGSGAARGAADDDDLQILTMNGERISVPELLLRPVDAGLPQAGLAEAVFEAIDGSPFAFHPPLWASVLLTGGTARLPGLRARLEQELRALAPAGLPVAVHTAADPIVAAWSGGARFAVTQPDALARRTVSRATYAEEGARALRRSFRLRLPGAQ